jgi:hypothetical protein
MGVEVPDMLKPRLASCAVLELGDKEAPLATDLSDDQYLIRCTELSKLLQKIVSSAFHFGMR